MRNSVTVYILIAIITCGSGMAQAEDTPSTQYQSDIFATSSGDLEITFIGHGTLMFHHNGLVVHLDPWSEVGDYTVLPAADVVLLTHDHSDHLDPDALALVRRDDTVVVCPPKCAEALQDPVVMDVGDTREVRGITVEAVSAYNMPRENRHVVHPVGEEIGFILTFGGIRVYIAGETDVIPEMHGITDIDIMFIAMDSKYNITPREAAEAVRIVAPRVLYPYHFIDSDLSVLDDLIEPETEVRIRELK